MSSKQPVVDQLRIVTFNIQDGGHHRENLLFDVLSDLQPDILFLQEVTHTSPVREWATQLGMESITANGNTFRRVAILSRYPIVSWRSHTPVPRLCRDFLSATVEIQPDKLLNVFCVHLAAQPFALFELLRLIEIKAVLRQTTQQSTVPCLIAGDFNAVGPTDEPVISQMPPRLKLMLAAQGWRFSHRVISAVQAAQYYDCYRHLHSEPGFTLPSSNPNVRFDYIFANVHLVSGLQTCRVVDNLPANTYISDHNPLMAEFSL